MKLKTNKCQAIFKQDKRLSWRWHYHSTILAPAIFKEGWKLRRCRHETYGSYKRHPDGCLWSCYLGIKELSIQVKNKEDLLAFATISANGDANIGGLVANIFEKLGLVGTIAVAEGKNLETEVLYVEGLKLDRGFISPNLLLNPRLQRLNFKLDHSLGRQENNLNSEHPFFHRSFDTTTKAIPYRWRC